MNTTIKYYNKNAKQFTEGTVDVDFSEIQERFLELLPKGGLILDLGCGAGRDTKYFLKRGYLVEALDGSEELCAVAKKNTGIDVKCMYFQDLNESEKYDGVWACASLLHLLHEEILPVLKKVENALKPNGIFYISFKYGEFEGERNGRYFTDMTEARMAKLLEGVEGFTVLDEWITNDVRPGREDEKWLNLFLKKA
jgi:SAM-dependent methyltransferase